MLASFRRALDHAKDTIPRGTTTVKGNNVDNLSMAVALEIQINLILARSARDFA